MHFVQRVVHFVHVGECARRHALLSQVTHAEQPTALSLCTILLQAFTAGSCCRLLQTGKCDTEWSVSTTDVTCHTFQLLRVIKIHWKLNCWSSGAGWQWVNKMKPIKIVNVHPMVNQLIQQIISFPFSVWRKNPIWKFHSTIEKVSQKRVGLFADFFVVALNWLFRYVCICQKMSALSWSHWVLSCHWMC